jgi:hypothetical protein
MLPRMTFTVLCTVSGRDHKVSTQILDTRAHSMGLTRSVRRSHRGSRLLVQILTVTRQPVQFESLPARIASSGARMTAIPSRKIKICLILRRICASRARLTWRAARRWARPCWRTPPAAHSPSGEPSGHSSKGTILSVMTLSVFQIKERAGTHFRQPICELLCLHRYALI